MATMLIQGGRVIDPANQLDQLLNLVIEDGAIAEITTGIPRTDEVIMAQGMIVSPGLVDLHVALRDPGGEEDEGTASGNKSRPGWWFLRRLRPFPIRTRSLIPGQC